MAEYFDNHWADYSVPKLSPSKITEGGEFLKPILKEIEDTGKGQWMLDVGCGDGVHAVILSDEKLNKHIYTGVDLSPPAVKTASKRIEETKKGIYNFQAGDVLNLPYRSASFDIVFSYGVLYYTGSIERGLTEMIRVCKKDGLIGLWLYPESEGIGGRLLKFTRWICRKLGKKLSLLIVHMIVPLLGILPMRSGMNLQNASWRQCAEVIAVNLLPEIFEFTSIQRAKEWFDKYNLKIEFIDYQRPVAIWGRK